MSGYPIWREPQVTPMPLLPEFGHTSHRQAWGERPRGTHPTTLRANAAQVSHDRHRQSPTHCCGSNSEVVAYCRLYHNSSRKRLHYNSRDGTLSLWAAQDGSGNADDNWTVLNGQGKANGDDWIIGAPFLLKHLVSRAARPLVAACAEKQ